MAETNIDNIALEVKSQSQNDVYTRETDEYQVPVENVKDKKTTQPTKTFDWFKVLSLVISILQLIFLLVIAAFLLVLLLTNGNEDATCDDKYVDVQTKKDEFQDKTYAFFDKVIRDLNATEEKLREEIGELKEETGELKQFITMSETNTRVFLDKIYEDLNKTHIRSQENSVELMGAILTNRGSSTEYFRNITSKLDDVTEFENLQVFLDDSFDNVFFKIENLSDYLNQPLIKPQEWIIIQRRTYFDTSFDRTWVEYENGFGYPASGDFWLGLHTMSLLTKTGVWKLRMTFDTWTDESHWTEYTGFSVGDASTKYRLTTGVQTGGSFTEGDIGRGWARQDGMKFSTRVVDNDIFTTENCAANRDGGWWYRDCDDVNFNSKRATSNADSHFHMKYYIPGQDQVKIKNSLMLIKLET